MILFHIIFYNATSLNINFRLKNNTQCHKNTKQKWLPQSQPQFFGGLHQIPRQGWISIVFLMSSLLSFSMHRSEVSPLGSSPPMHFKKEARREESRKYNWDSPSVCVHQWSLIWSSSSSLRISPFRKLMVSLLAFSLSFRSVISWLVFFFAASSFSRVRSSSSATTDTGRVSHQWHCPLSTAVVSLNNEDKNIGFYWLPLHRQSKSDLIGKGSDLSKDQ